ncbi:inner membrane transporter RhtA [Actinokineospora auranticolor]|uniref:Inner membrane transporter RhtA n=1 Tax=Actinokineospora auranticolor TaxID=155976 RepID=A0A2S6GHL1_9PSEU|nr:inner membrane transporter RhtA [Actinokineospora auranticolor]
MLAGAPARVGAVPPTVQVLIAIVSVQVGAAVAKQLFTAAGAAGAVTLRLGLAAVVFVLLWRPSLKLNRHALPVILGYGAVLGTMNLCFYLAIERIPLGIAVTVEFLGPLAVALVGSRRWLDGLWALLAAAGVVLLSQTGGDADLVGLLFALAAGACWAFYILLGAALGSRTTDGSGLALASVVAAALVVPFGVADAGTTLLEPSVLVAGLGVALMSSVVPYSLELKALRSLPPRVFGVLMSLEPAVAALAGLVVLGEALRPTQWVAICCVVAASAGATRYGRPKPE